MFESTGITVAVLFSETCDGHIGLLLHPSTALMQDAARPKYHVGHGFRRANGSLCVRQLVALARPRGRDLFIADAPPTRERDERLVLRHALHCLRPAPPLRVPHWLLGRLAALGLELRRPTVVSHPSAEGEPLLCMLRFQDLRGREAVEIVMGTCDRCVLGDEEDEEDDGTEEASQRRASTAAHGRQELWRGRNGGSGFSETADTCAREDPPFVRITVKNHVIRLMLWLVPG
ncbi:uncharacterized protein BXZ73DRAFT_78012 [Epithele typhae]|uniref:uncharacterized protein n=1 Tax=Epithele typhae TaxID=378194 RepID=UPI0020077FD3|nr:uncharacterized protein BXZ73DRAFT_78012 [Epithele typhae]KAH9929903.1 hypothetical protein BXZ73DRAFT_78012 [Epithele typhae]